GVPRYGGRGEALKQTYSADYRHGDSREMLGMQSRLATESERNLNYDLEYDPELKPAWHVIWTRSNCESLVTEQLQQKGYDVFLPMVTEWMRNEKGRYAVRVPMFRSYVFVHQAIGRHEYLDIC